MYLLKQKYFPRFLKKLISQLNESNLISFKKFSRKVNKLLMMPLNVRG